MDHSCMAAFGSTGTCCTCIWNRSITPTNASISISVVVLVVFAAATRTATIVNFDHRHRKGPQYQKGSNGRGGDNKFLPGSIVGGLVHHTHVVLRVVGAAVAVRKPYGLLLVGLVDQNQDLFRIGRDASLNVNAAATACAFTTTATTTSSGIFPFLSQRQPHDPIPPSAVRSRPRFRVRVSIDELECPVPRISVPGRPVGHADTGIHAIGYVAFRHRRTAAVLRGTQQIDDVLDRQLRPQDRVKSRHHVEVYGWQVF
mmetsp:Transcript_26399/g.56674  ORF Transcript_26399/g.56674 Transcript_26399/m.56674 type:complete len:257 (-) Transcript_26399:474-1244(-)